MKYILVVTLAALAACGGGGGGGDDRPAAPTGPSNPSNPSNPGTPTTPSQSASVDMRSTEQGGIYGDGTYTHAFAPPEVTIRRGGSVTWTNGSGFSHGVDFSDVGAPDDIAVFGSGTVSRTFQTAGTFSYRCSVHPSMMGSVVVQ